MIRYRHLTIENYKSIEFAQIDFTPGVFKVIGRNINGDYSSNGASKSSVLQALSLVLYNKDFQGAPLDSISNRYTEKSYKLTLLMDVDRDGLFAQYEVINDRAIKKITVKRDGVVISTAVSKSLAIIQDIIGMSESTFKFTHYITTSSILELTRNLSNATLFNEVLQVTQLKTMGDDFLTIKKALTKEKDEVFIRFQELRSINKLLKVTDKYDLVSLKEEGSAIRAELSNYQHLYNENIDPLIATLDKHKENQKEILIELREKRNSEHSGICSLCNTLLTSEDTLIELKSSIENLEEDSKYIKDLIDKDSAILEKYTSAYQIDTVNLKEKLNRVEKDLTMGRQLASIHKEMLEDSKGFSKELFKELALKLRSLRSQINQIDKMRDAIRSGRIFEDIMKDFFTLVNINIQKYREVINLTSFDVEATSFKSGMVILLRHHGVEIPVESLSNGEKARLSLLVLSALLESMQQTTQSDSNFISFDEATSSFDKSGILELKNLFIHLKSLEQSCFIITHGSELEEVPFDGTLTMVKEDNRATAEFILNEKG